jgi:hypothetical protein
MENPRETLVELENQFWQSIVDQDTDTALELLTEPALMVSTHGAMRFDHAGYRQMAEKGSMVLKKFRLSDMEVLFPNESTAVITYHVKQQLVPRGKNGVMDQEMNDTSTWIKDNGEWKCVIHTETPAGDAHKS